MKLGRFYKPAESAADGNAVVRTDVAIGVYRLRTICKPSEGDNRAPSSQARRSLPHMDFVVRQSAQAAFEKLTANLAVSFQAGVF